MAKIITLFSHKGGVGKTTTAQNIAVSLTKKGKNVLLIDADAQMNLTSSVLGLSDSVEYADTNESKWNKLCAEYTNIKDYLDWYTAKDLKTEKLNIKLFDYNPKNIYPDLFQTHERGLLSLLLGHIKIFEIEATLYSISTNKSLQDSNKFYLIQEGIKSLASCNNRDYDYIIIDTSPSASSILNGTFLMMSDYFLCPVLPNFFSLQAIDNLQEIVKNWVLSLDNFRATTNTRGLKFCPKFLGIVINVAKRFKKGNAREVTIYAEQWREKINVSVDKYCKYALDSDRVLPKDKFKDVFLKSSPYIISEICDFTGNLRSVSEITGIPIVDLDNNIVRDGCEKLGIRKFTIEKVRKNTKDDHYKRAFLEACESYNYIAESLMKL